MLTIISLRLLALTATLALASCGTTRMAVKPEITSIQAQRQYVPISQELKDSLLAEFATNKEIPQGWEDQILIALMGFHELRNTHITFKYAQGISTTMAAYPAPASAVFSPRRYLVVIGGRRARIPLESASFNAQIGVIAHELSHIVDYQNKNLTGLLGTATEYVGKRSRARYENYIDSVTIARGYGWQLLDWAEYSLSDQSPAPEKYREYKREVYMNPQRMKEIMRSLPIYQKISLVTNWQF